MCYNTPAVCVTAIPPLLGLGGQGPFSGLYLTPHAVKLVSFNMR